MAGDGPFGLLAVSVRSPLTRQAAISFAIKLFATACAFMFAVIAARLLGATSYGVVAVALSVMTTAAIIAPLGSNGLAVREVAQSSVRSEWCRLRRFLRWSATLVAITSIALAALITIAAPMLDDYGAALPYAAAIIPFMSGIHLLKGVIQGASRPIWAQIPGDALRWAVIFLAISILALLPRHARPSDILIVYLVGCVVAMVLSALVARRLVANMPRTGNPPINPRWFKQALPFLGIAGLGILGGEINTILLGWLSGPREAGLYQPIARLAPLMLIVREAVEMPLAPRIVHDWEGGDRAALQRRLRLAALASALVTVLVSGVIVLAGPAILGAFGDDFRPYADLLVWIGLAQVINSAMGASPLLLAMVGAMKGRIAIQVLTLMVQIGLGALLIPLIGARGAAASLVAAILTWSLVHWAVAWRTTGIETSALLALKSERA